MKRSIFFYLKYAPTLLIVPLALVLFTTQTKDACAQSPLPDPVVACNNVKSNEFHSLRPYQASVCNKDYPVALYCGNSVFLTDTFSVDENGTATPSDPGTSVLEKTCETRVSDGVKVCTFTLRRTKTFSIDLRGAKLPIMGNTENVRNVTNNAIPPQELINDQQKVNEYVSWYLNGVPNASSYGAIENKDPNTVNEPNAYPKNIRTQIDYSGPLNKLLPLRIQQRERIKTIQNAVASVNNTANGEDQRHNQIVGCTREKTEPIYFLGQLIGNRWVSLAIPCNTSIWDSILNGPIKLTRRLSDWSSNTPPLEENYQNRTFSDYLKDYKQWRGNICTTISVSNIQFLVCVNPGWIAINNPNWIASLFPFIPYSSTEDTEGKIRVEQNPQPMSQSGDVEVSNETVSQNEAALNFPHMAETNQLADTLQQTYVPKDLDLNALADTNTVVGDEFCNVVQIKTNPGDSLFPNPEQLTPELNYDAKFSCAFPLKPQGSCEITGADGTPVTGECVPSGFSCSQEGASTCGSGYKCGVGCDGPSTPDCNVSTNHTIPVYTETPYADSVWSKLVAGPSSVFKKIFPKVGFDGPIQEIVDAPAAINTSYTTNNPGTNVTAANARAGVEAELYLPHIGGIQEYFLECVQTALRPLGLGRLCGDFATQLDKYDPTGTILGSALVPNTSNAKYPQVEAFNTSIELTGNPFQRAMFWTKGETVTNFGNPTDLGQADGVSSYTSLGLWIGKNGTTYVSWIDLPSQTVYMRSKPANGSWGQVRTVVQAGEFISSSRIAVSSNGTIFVIWHSQNGFVMYKTSNDDGNTWSTQNRVLDTAAYASNPSSISAGPNGEVMVGLVSDTGRIYVATWNGNRFSTEEASQGFTGKAFNPTVTYGPSGKAYAVWRGIGTGVALAEKEASGGWKITSVTTTGDASGTIALSVDTQEGVHVAWYDPNGGNLLYRYRPVNGEWSTIGTIKGNGNFMANADGTTSSNGKYFHVVIEDFSFGTPRIRYFLISGNPGSSSGCNGQTLSNPLGNFGDPNCTFTKDKLMTLLRQLDPVNANFWFNTVVQCESWYNPNAYNPVSENASAWGLFQMGPSYLTDAQGNLVLDKNNKAIPNPGQPPNARGLNGIYDRGDVPWEIQISKAVSYNNYLRSNGREWQYWSCARSRW